MKIHKILTKTFTAGLLITIVLGTNCKKQTEPTACLTADKTEAYKGSIIIFTNCSENYVTSEIDFGDGSSTKISNPSHQFNETGDFNIRMRVIDAKGNSAFQNSEVSIYKYGIKSVETIHSSLIDSTNYSLVLLDNMNVKTFPYRVERIGKSSSIIFDEPLPVDTDQLKFTTCILPEDDWSMIYDTAWYAFPTKEKQIEEKTIALHDPINQLDFNINLVPIQ